VSGRPLVLVVDDEPSVLQALARALRGEPYELRVTTDPEEAGRAIREGGVDVLLVDYKMPGMNGNVLLSLAAEASPRTARVLLTGCPGESLPPAGALMASAVLEKPWDGVRLRATLREALAGRGLDSKKDPST